MADPVGYIKYLGNFVPFIPIPHQGGYTVTITFLCSACGRGYEIMEDLIRHIKDCLAREKVLLRRITPNQLSALRDFLGDYEIEDEWFERHTMIEFDDVTHTMKLEIDNINEQEWEWLKGGANANTSDGSNL